MKHVSLKSIEAAIKFVDNLDDDGLEQLAEKYANTQPNLLSYLLSAALEYENEALEGYIIYYYCLILEAFGNEGIAFDIISEEAIDAIQDPYFEMLDAYFDSEDEEILESFCDQPELAKFMALEISTEDEDGSSLDDETATQIFIVTIALISILSRSEKK